MGRGSSKTSGRGLSVSAQNSIKNAFLSKGLNSRFKGIARDAKNGTGNYAFKNAKAVNIKTALKMTSMRLVEHDGKSLIHGLIGNKHVFFADNSNSKSITALKQRMKALKSGNNSKADNINITPTSTYDRWHKRNTDNFSAWFGRNRI